MSAFSISGEQYFDVISQPVLMARSGMIAYMNAAAHTAMPSLSTGDTLPSVFPSEVSAAAEATLEKQRWQIRSYGVDSGILYHLTAVEQTALTGEDAYSFSVGLKIAMSPMLTALEALQNELAETELERNRSRFAALNQSYYRLLHTVDCLSFYSLATMDAENLYRPEILNLTRFCQEMQNNLTIPVEQTGHTLTLENASEPLFIQGDRRLLERLFCQLCANATKAGGDITIRLMKQQHRAHLTITDNGSGISDFTLNNAFTAKPIHLGGYTCGVGFGLAICQEISRLHKGIMVISRQKHGTQAAISLPLCGSDTLDTPLRSNGPVIAGGLSQVLLEMSDVLPQSCYDPAAIF